MTAWPESKAGAIVYKHIRAEGSVAIMSGGVAGAGSANANDDALADFRASLERLEERYGRLLERHERVVAVWDRNRMYARGAVEAYQETVRLAQAEVARAEAVLVDREQDGAREVRQAADEMAGARADVETGRATLAALEAALPPQAVETGQKRKREDIKQDTDCSICFEPKNGVYAFMPCRDAKMCLECSRMFAYGLNGQVKKCPSCRKDIDSLLVVFT